MSASLNYRETTGSFLRVGVMDAASEDEAIAFAEGEVGGFSYNWTDSTGEGEWEIVFDRSDWL